MNLNPINSRLRVSLGGAIILAMFAALPARADYQSTVLAQGPAGYWRLSETTQPAPNGTAANLGTLGSSADGTYNNDPARQLPGPFAGSDAIGLDGSSQTVTSPYQAGLNPSSFTIEAWVNPASATVSGGLLCVAASVHAASPRAGWLIYQSDGTAAGAPGVGWYLRMYDTNGTAFSIQLLAPQVNAPGTWTHLVFSFDGTTAVAYTNGVLAGSEVPSGFVPNADSNFEIGARSDGAFYWPGEVAEVAYYSGALSQTRVSAHYTAATTAPATYATTVNVDSPVLYYRFREPADVTAANIGTLGSAATGKYAVGTTPGVPGPRPPPFIGFEAGNDAVSFDGTGPSVAVPALNFNTNTVTITGWLKPSTSAQTPYGGIVVCHAGTTDAGLIMDSTGGLGLGYRWGNDTGTYNWQPSGDSGLPNLPASDWAYVALVVQPNQAAIYLCDSTNAVDWAGATNTIFAPTHAIQAFDGDTLFGWSAAPNLTGGFAGDIDEVAMFDRALGEGELYTQYGAAVGGLQPVLFGDLQGPPGSVAAGDPFSLIVDAGGTPPLSFIWRTNSVPVATTSSNTLVIASSTLNDSASYDVIISNAQGTVTSSAVAVSVVTPSLPSIVQLLGYQNRTLYPTGTLSFAVSATGGGLKYQWYKNASPVASATSSAFSIASVTTNDAGSYSVSVTNVVGTATSGPPAVITIPSVIAGSYEAAIIASAPEAWWRLDEPAGSTNMFDGMGRHPGNYTNAAGAGPLPTLGVTGALVGDPNTAASFTSAGQGIGIAPFSPKLNAPEMSVEAWVNTSVNNGQAPVSSSYGSGGWWMESVAGWWLGDSSAGTFGNNSNLNTAAVIIPGQWSHIVIEYNAANATYPFQLYVNEQTDGYIWGGPAAGLNSSGPFIIGAHGVSASTLADSFFDGQVDEVAVYTRLLSSTEISNHYAARGTTIIPVTFTAPPLSQTVTAGKSISFSATVVGTPPIYLQWYKGGAPITGATTNTYTIASTALGGDGTYTLWATNAASTNSISANLTVIPPVSYANVTNGLVLHLRFDGDYSDSSGRGNNATAPAGSPPFLLGQIGQAVHIDTTPGTNYLVVSDNQGDLTFDQTASFTVAFWVRYTDRFQDDPIIGNATNSTYQLGWVFTDEGGQIECSLVSTANSGAYVANPVAGSPIIGNGAWHQVLGVVDRSAQLASVYVDGVLAGSWSIVGLGTLDYGNPITIGQDPTGNYGSAIFDLDDVGIWRQALTPLQAAQIESAGSTSGHSFDTVAPPSLTLTITRSGGNVVLNYASGTLLSSTNLGPSAVWTAVPNANPPSFTVTPGGAGSFYRVQIQ